MTLPGSPVGSDGGNEARADAPLRSSGRTLSLDDFVVLNEEIRAFVRAGIPLDLGLRGTATRADGRLGQVASRVSERISQGLSLQAAIEAEGQAIPAEYRALLAAGMKSGRLPELLSSLSDLGESVSNLQRQLRLALVYPAIVFVLAYVLFTGFVMFVVPHLIRSQQMFRTEESPFTRELGHLHDTVSIWGPAIPGVLIALLLISTLGRRLARSESHLMDGMRWLPGARDVAVSRFARVLTVLVDHNVPLPEACRLSGEACGHESLRQAGNRLARNIESGEPLSVSVEREQQLPAFLRWLMTVGEQQGALASSLRQATAIYEQRALTKLDWFRRIVPPTIILVFGGLITLAYGLSLFLPMTQMLKSLEEVSR